MKQHTILITFNEAGEPVPLCADGTQIQAECQTQPGDQVRWLSPHGKVSVTFPGPSPFQDGSSTGDSVFRVLPKDGSFVYNCAVITSDGQSHGWPTTRGGGGTVEVGGGTR
jgi:hypothetical protein